MVLKLRKVRPSLNEGVIMFFLTFLILLAMAYFLYSISETLIDIKDELRAANRNREIALHQGAEKSDTGQ